MGTNEHIWSKLFSINYMFEYRYSDARKKEYLKFGINPFEHYRNKFNQEFETFELSEKQIKKLDELSLSFMLLIVIFLMLNLLRTLQILEH